MPVGIHLLPPGGVKMRVLVTGAAGFIGRTLAEHLIAEGNSVIAVDRRAEGLMELVKFAQIRQQADLLRTVQAELVETPLDGLLDDVEVVAHLAGRGNVRSSFSEADLYIRDNIEVTDRLSAAIAGSGSIRTVLLASSSSVYGGRTPWAETDVPAPYSPYGVTKLAGEHAARVRLADTGVTLVTVRPFSVYGPRQRPDLVLSRLLECALQGREFALLGDGQQRRDFTFVEDIVSCMVRLLTKPVAGTYNLCAGKSHSVLELTALVDELIGRKVMVRMKGFRDGWLPEPPETLGVNDAVQRACGPIHWTELREGMAQQVEWQLATDRDKY
jgi:UDP-glucuronate 4-epimerase